MVINHLCPSWDDPPSRGRSWFLSIFGAPEFVEDLQERKPQDYVELVGVSLVFCGVELVFVWGAASRKIPILGCSRKLVNG